MAEQIQQVMTRDPVTLQGSASILEAAEAMRDHDIGTVVVLEDGKVAGVVTDRDIVVRGLAKGIDPASTPVSQVCSSGLVTLSPEDDIEKAVKLMRDKAIRRVPVVSDGKAVGIVSIGDLAIQRDPESALADISGASPNK
jgi:CBS domain-containing protein